MPQSVLWYVKITVNAISIKRSVGVDAPIPPPILATVGRCVPATAVDKTKDVVAVDVSDATAVQIIFRVWDDIVFRVTFNFERMKINHCMQNYLLIGFI